MTPTKDEIEAQRQSVDAAISKRIFEEWSGWHPAEFEARAEMIAEELVPPGWEWTISTGLGPLPPSVVLLRFDPRKAQ